MRASPSKKPKLSSSKGWPAHERLLIDVIANKNSTGATINVFNTRTGAKVLKSTEVSYM